MNNKSKISIIVPVFNSEKYLPKCLNSLIYQTYDNLEIICINDGSTDNSQEILQNYALKDSRISIFQQNNSGTSSARNLGLANASGDYISFIDSDDWVLLTLYQTFVQTLEKVQTPVDIFMFNVGSFMENSNDILPRTFFNLSEWNNHSSKYSVHTFDDCKNPLARNLSVANKIYLKNFLTNLNISFPENIKYEDQYVHLKTFLHAKSILINENIFYRYRNYNSGSAQTEISPKVFDIFKITDMIEKEIISTNQQEAFKYALFQYKYNNFFQHYYLCPENLKEMFFNEAKNRLLSVKNLDIQICRYLKNFEIFTIFVNSDFQQFDNEYNKRVLK